MTISVITFLLITLFTIIKADTIDDQNSKTLASNILKCIKEAEISIIGNTIYHGTHDEIEIKRRNHLDSITNDCINKFSEDGSLKCFYHFDCEKYYFCDNGTCKPDQFYKPPNINDKVYTLKPRVYDIDPLILGNYECLNYLGESIRYDFYCYISTIDWINYSDSWNNYFKCVCEKAGYSLSTDIFKKVKD